MAAGAFSRAGEGRVLAAAVEPPRSTLANLPSSSGTAMNKAATPASTARTAPAIIVINTKPQPRSGDLLCTWNECTRGP